MKTTEVLDKAFEGTGLTYKVTRKHKPTCAFCDFPQWEVNVMAKHDWSDGVVEFDVIKVNLHNFIEVDEVMSIKASKRRGLGLGIFRSLEELQTNLIKEFNAQDSSIR